MKNLHGATWGRGRYSRTVILEYGLLVALVAVLILAGAFAFGDVLAAWFTAILGHIV